MQSDSVKNPDSVTTSKTTPTAKTPQKSKAAPAPATKSNRSEPNQTLPTDRIAFDKQLQLLLAYAAASDSGRKAVSNEEIADLVEPKMKASTVSLANAFFTKTGLLSRSGREYTPAKEVLDFKLANEWDAATAAFKLAPLMERTWFAQALRPKLEMRQIDESEAISELAQRASAGPEYRNQIKTLIDYLAVSGVVQRDGNLIALARRRGDASEAAADKPAPAQAAGAEPSPPPNMDQIPFGQVGSIKFSVAINVDMKQMVTWEASRISAFFTGLAQVLAAQKGGKN